jgi:signal transduction histidine kinase
MAQENSKSIFFLKITIIVSFAGFLLYALFYTIISASVLLPIIITVSVFLLLDIVIYIEYRKKWYKLAKYSIMNLLSSTIFVIVFIFMGPAPGVHYFFLVFAVLPILLFSYKNIYSWLAYAIISIALFIWAEIYLQVSLQPTDLPESILIPFKIATIVITMGIICFALWIYYRSSLMNEEELNKQASTLEEQLVALEEQQELLRNANATKDKFSSIIAHDLKNPISSIVGFTELLSSKIEDLEPEKVRKYLEMILISSRSLDELIKSLVQWSRSQARSIQIQRESFSLNQLFIQNIELQKLTADQKGLKLSSTCPEDLTIIADYNMIDTAIRNLLSNALKFTHKGGSVKLSASQKNGITIIQVSDTGIGMYEDTQLKLFRIDQSISTDGTKGEKGTGLGLVIAKEFVLKHQGEIRVDSKKDQGTTFMITLPQNPSAQITRDDLD